MKCKCCGNSLPRNKRIFCSLMCKNVFHFSQYDTPKSTDENIQDFIKYYV